MPFNLQMKTPQELFEEVEKLKEINLVDFVCCTAGFSIDEEATRKENGNTPNPKYIFVENEAGDKLLISRIYSSGRQQYLYRNIFNELDKGNIISFIKYRTNNFSISLVKKRVHNFQKNIEKGYYKTTGVSIQMNSKENHTETNIKEIARRYQRLPDFIHQQYLKSRGLSHDILNSHLCKDRIRNEYIYYPRISSTTKPAIKYINTVFPIYGSDGSKTFLCGYVRKNEGLKTTAKDSRQSIGVWTSDYRRKEKVSHLIISENPIDSISYCQMKIDYRLQNPMLVASNGELSKSQLELYQEIISRLRPGFIVLANDNNCKGQLFNAKILSSLSLPDNYQDTEYYVKNKLIVDADIHAGYQNKFTGEITWKFKHEKLFDNMTKEKYIQEHIPQFQRVVQYYEAANKELVLINDESPPLKIEKQFHELHSEIKISFHNSKVNWIEINKSLVVLKFDYSEQLQIEIPRLADFNEDLKESLGIRTEEKQIFPNSKNTSLNI